MANDGEISIDTKVDTKGLDKGLRSVNDKVKKTSKEIEKSTKPVEGLKVAFNETGGAAAGFTQKMNGLASSGGAVAVGITAAVMAAKKYIDTLKEANEAYEVQEKAERALSAAAENNPYLNPESVQRLKEYAGELQKVSNYGDEGTIDIMAQLASTGRTESEIMKIMGAAADYAAAKHIDLKTAAETLNSTYSGMAGTMGRQIAEIEDLTDEQLKNGDAIDLIAKKYKGFAAEAVDSGTQAKNAFGDFMESIGKIANPVFEALDAKAKSFWESMTSHMDGFNKALEKARETWVIGGDYQGSKDFVKGINENLKSVNPTKKTMYLEDNAESLSDENIRHITVYLETRKKLNENEKELLGILQKEKAHRDKVAEARNHEVELIARYKDASKQELEARLKVLQTTSAGDAKETRIVHEQLQKRIQEEKEAREKEAQEEAKERDKLRDQYDETIRQKQEEIKQRRINGEEISAETEAQELYNTAFSAYVKMMSDPAFKGNSGNYKHEVDARQSIASWYNTAQSEEGKRKLSEQMDAFLAELQEAADEANGVVKDQYQLVLDMLDDEFDKIVENKYMENEQRLRLEQEYAMKRGEIVAAMLDDEKRQLLEKTGERTQLEQSSWGKYETGLQSLLELRKEISASEVLTEKEKTKALEDVERKHLEEKEGLLDELSSKNQEWYEKYRQEQQELLDLKREIDQSEIASEEEKAEAIEAINERLKESKANQYAETMAQTSSYTSQAVDIINQAANLMLETSQNEARAEQAELEEKYRRGEISEEEYQEAITNSKKKAAKEQYKIQMVQWAASILQATANIAEGVTKAIAQGGIAGLISGALVSAAGAVQIASIIANKPTPPNFAGGGFIGGMNGATMGSDNTYIHARTGEMVANAAQQRNLWEAMNGNGGGSGTNIVINNSASNIATAQPKITRDKIEIMIDARVNDSLKNGRYDQSMSEAQAGMTGDYYGI
jgi:hypothetical protein